MKKMSQYITSDINWFGGTKFSFRERVVAIRWLWDIRDVEIYWDITMIKSK